MERDRERICPHCGKLFIPIKSTHKYCCHECYKAAWFKRRAERGKCVYQPRQCAVCGKVFTPSTPLQKTCGGECSRLYLRQVYGTGNGKKQAEQDAPFDRLTLAEFGEIMSKHQAQPARIEHSHRMQSVLQDRYSYLSPDVRHAKFYAAIRHFDSAFPDWRDLSMTRQIALVELYLALGLSFFKRSDIQTALTAQDYAAIKSAVLLTRWAGENGRYAISLIRAIADDFWQ